MHISNATVQAFVALRRQLQPLHFAPHHVLPQARLVKEVAAQGLETRTLLQLLSAKGEGLSHEVSHTLNHRLPGGEETAAWARNLFLSRKKPNLPKTKNPFDLLS